MDGSTTKNNAYSKDLQNISRKYCRYASCYTADTHIPAHNVEETLTKNNYSHKMFISKQLEERTYCSLMHGFIPFDLVHGLNYTTDAHLRLLAMTELHIILNDHICSLKYQQRNGLSTIVADFHSFFHMLQRFFEDENICIVIKTFNILRSFVEDAPITILEKLQDVVVKMVLKNLGESKHVIQLAIVHLLFLLVKRISLRFVIEHLLDTLNNKHTRIRQNALDIITSVLLTFASPIYSLQTIILKLAPLLFDEKRQVRSACIECYMVIAHHLTEQGSSLNNLFQSMTFGLPSSVTNDKRDHMFSIIMDRLKSKKIPRLGPDGCLEYATPILTSATLAMPSQTNRSTLSKQETRLRNGKSVDNINQDSNIVFNYPFTTKFALNELKYPVSERFNYQQNPKKANAYSNCVKFSVTESHRQVTENSNIQQVLQPQINSYSEQYAMLKQAQINAQARHLVKWTNNNLVSGTMSAHSKSVNSQPPSQPLLHVSIDRLRASAEEQSKTIAKNEVEHAGLVVTQKRSSPRWRNSTGSDIHVLTTTPLVSQRRRNSISVIEEMCDGNYSTRIPASKLAITSAIPRYKSPPLSLSIDRHNQQSNTVKARRSKRPLNYLTNNRDDDLNVNSPKEIANSVLIIKNSVSRKMDSIRSQLSQTKDEANELRFAIREANGQRDEVVGNKAYWATRSLNLANIGAKDVTNRNKMDSFITDATAAEEDDISGGIEIETANLEPPNTRLSSGYASEDVKKIPVAEENDCVRNNEVENYFAKRSAYKKQSKRNVPLPVTGVPPIYPKVRSLSRRISSPKSTIRDSRLNVPVSSNSMQAMQPHATQANTNKAILHLTSQNWEEQNWALAYLTALASVSNKNNTTNESSLMKEWSVEQIHVLCLSCVKAVASLRSQISRAAIGLVRKLSQVLSTRQLSVDAQHVLSALFARVSGDASTAFLRNEAKIAFEELLIRLEPLLALACLHSIERGGARSVASRIFLSSCYSQIVAPALLGQSSTNSSFEPFTSAIGLVGKRKDAFDRFVTAVVGFLVDGNFETRQNGKEVIRLLASKIAGFDGYCERTLTARQCNQLKDTLLKLRIKKSAFSTAVPLLKKRLTRETAGGIGIRRVQNNYSFVSNASVPNLWIRPPPSQRKCLPPLSTRAIDSRKDKIKCLQQLGEELCRPPALVTLPTANFLEIVLPTLSKDVSGDVKLQRAAILVCLDAGRLKDNATARQGDEMEQERFPNGLFELLCFREEADEFTLLLGAICLLLYASQQLHEETHALASSCLATTRRILGPEALVKPMLTALSLADSSQSTDLIIQELCDITADLDNDSPLLSRYLLPRTLELLLQRKEEAESLVNLVKCLYNQLGDGVMEGAAAEMMSDEDLTKVLAAISQIMSVSKDI